MKTHVPKKAEINRKWYIIDAKDKVLGRIATVIANKLRGKDKPIFVEYMDCGDFIVVINTDKIKLTGNKLQNKIYYRHTGFPGGIISPTAGEMMEKKPNQLLELAVRGMLPKNRLRKEFMKKLKLFNGESHDHEAQKPELLAV